MEPIRERVEDFLRRWRSRYERNRVFRVLVITVVLVAVCVTSAGYLQAPTYEASAQVWVDVRSPTQGTGNGKIQLIPNAPAPEALQAFTQTIIGAIDSRPVAEEAIQRLGLQMGAVELLDNLTVEQIEATRFIRLTYEDTDPERAKQIVNMVSKVSSELAERSGTLTAKVWDKATLPESPASPHPLRNGLLTLVVGLVLSAVLLLPRPHLLAARVAGSLVGPAVRPIGEAELPIDPSEAERSKEQELLEALGRRGKLTAVEATLETSLEVAEADRILEELAFAGQLKVTVEHGRLYYAFWEHDAPL